MNKFLKYKLKYVKNRFPGENIEIQIGGDIDRKKFTFNVPFTPYIGMSPKKVLKIDCPEVELQICKKIYENPHKNIIKFLEIDLNQRDILMEKIESRVPKKSEYKKYFSDIKKGLNHLKKLGIIHRDIKWPNIGYSKKDKNWKIFDFDAGAMFNNKNKYTLIADKYHWITKKQVEILNIKPNEIDEYLFNLFSKSPVEEKKPYGYFFHNINIVNSKKNIKTKNKYDETFVCENKNSNLCLSKYKLLLRKCTQLELDIYRTINNRLGRRQNFITIFNINYDTNNIITEKLDIRVPKKNEYKQYFSNIKYCLDILQRYRIVIPEIKWNNIGYSEIDKVWKIQNYTSAGFIASFFDRPIKWVLEPEGHIYNLIKQQKPDINIADINNTIFKMFKKHKIIEESPYNHIYKSFKNLSILNNEEKHSTKKKSTRKTSAKKKSSRKTSTKKKSTKKTSTKKKSTRKIKN